MQRPKQPIKQATKPGKKKDKDTILAKALERTIEADLKSHAAEMKIAPFDIHKYVAKFIHHEFFINLVNILKRTIKNDVEDVVLNKEQRNHLSTELGLKDTPIECARRILQLIVTEIQQNSQWINSGDFKPSPELSTYLSTLEADFQAYKINKYTAIDDREYLNQDDALRRMDSLARLFNLANGVSVCTAVAVHENELILSFNASDNDQQDAIASVACQRIQIIQSHLAKISNMSLDYYHLNQDEINSDTAEQLAALHPTVIPKNVIMQALDKLSHALVFDDNTLDPEITDVLRNPAIPFRILLPHVENNQIKICSLAYANATANPLIELLDVNVKLKEVHVSRAHAEQMLAHFVFINKQSKNYNAENKLNIGITKLCCQSCRNNLKNLDVKVRGAHGEVRERTINFIIKEGFILEEAKTPKRRATQADNSPHDSAKKKAVIRQGHKRPTYHDSSLNDMTDVGNERENQNDGTPSKKIALDLERFSIRSRPPGAPSPRDQNPDDKYDRDRRNMEESPRKRK